MRKLILPLALLALIGIALAAGAFVILRSEPAAPAFRLASVERGDVEAAVAASGTVTPVVTVQVGSQISGQIRSIEADFNTLVKKGQVIARLDPEIFETKVAQAGADLDVARASVAVQEATLERSRADLDAARQIAASLKAQSQKSVVVVEDAEREYRRRLELFQSGTSARSDMDKAKAAFDTGAAQSRSSLAQELAQQANIRSVEAQLKIGEAQLANARAQAAQRAAALRQAQIDLDRTIIRSPIDGVVVLRNVDAGQTVAASLQAPILFLIAEDLKRMQIEVSVDEADVGRVRKDLPVSFTIDAYPGRSFQGQVRQVRIAPKPLQGLLGSTVGAQSNTQNVVSYVVIVSTENTDLALFPGMTANARIITERRTGVLKVPNSALRFRPPDAANEQKASTSGNPWARPNAEEQARALKQRLARTLNLKPDQQIRLDEIVADMQTQLAALQGLPEAERRRRSDQVRTDNQARIMAILDGAQKAVYAEQNAGARSGGATGQVHVRDEAGLPRRVLVRLGITDGSHTEIADGALAEGEQVLTGIAARATPERTPANALRTGLLGR